MAMAVLFLVTGGGGGDTGTLSAGGKAGERGKKTQTTPKYLVLMNVAGLFFVGALEGA